MTTENLIYELRSAAYWAEQNIWDVPLMLPDILKMAATYIEKYSEMFPNLKI